mmetsp:Transcript_15440/g.33709  ORF Transcript_15440/g.33709 Transcript_15440/m.33709 type:complete len:227 (+) Transcript_15440:687-1367(+)
MHGHNFGSKFARPLGGRRLLMRRGGKFIEFVSLQLIFLGDIVRRDTHGQETIHGGGILGQGNRLATAAGGQSSRIIQFRRFHSVHGMLRHAFHSRTDSHGNFARPNAIGNGGTSLQPRSALTIGQRQGAGFGRQPRGDLGHAQRSRTILGRWQHGADANVLNVRGGKVAMAALLQLFQRAFQDGLQQGGRGQVGQGTLTGSTQGCAEGRDNDNVIVGGGQCHGGGD